MSVDRPITLKTIVTTFCAPIKEEHAWAIIFNGLKKLTHLNQKEIKCLLVTDVENIIINADGDVDDATFTEDIESSSRPEMINLATGIAELAVIVYDALDWELSFERKLSSDLEEVIDLMTSADDMEQHDEGISIGDDDMNTDLCQKIFGYCCKHHNTTSLEDVTHHYREVSKALVAEVLQLTNFMSRLSDENLLELEMLERKDWAGVFNNVMDELRNGVKLRNVSMTEKHKEFSMTPYEMLMEDIRSRKAVLKPPNIPTHVEIAARDQIMSFIKSKPTLKPVSERKLASPVHDETPAEKLMSDIRGGKARQSLRRTRPKLKTSTLVQSLEKVASAKEEEKHKGNGRVVITIDDKMHSSMLNFEDDTPENSGDEEHVFNYKEVKDEHEVAPSKPEDLTLQEMCHIRSQMTRAELEQKNLTKDERIDLDKGKVCFLCNKTRFNLFNWSSTCHLCKRQICRNCSTKMRIPNQTSDILVSSLSNQLDVASEDEFDEDDFEDKLSTSPLPLQRNQPQRGSLKVQRTPEPRSFSRSKTLSKAQAKLSKKQAAKIVANFQQNSLNITICLDCKDTLANVIWSNKRSPKSPKIIDKKKSVLDLQSMTISRRRLSNFDIE